MNIFFRSRLTLCKCVISPCIQRSWGIRNWSINYNRITVCAVLIHADHSARHWYAHVVKFSAWNFVKFRWRSGWVSASRAEVNQNLRVRLPVLAGRRFFSFLKGRNKIDQLSCVSVSKNSFSSMENAIPYIEGKRAKNLSHYVLYIQPSLASLVNFLVILGSQHPFSFNFHFMLI